MAIVAVFVMGLTTAFSALAAPAGDSLVPVGALTGHWTVADHQSSNENGSDSASQTLVRDDGIVAQVTLIGLQSAGQAQTVQQYVIDKARASMPSGFAITSTSLYGDANAYAFTGSAEGKTGQAYLFVDKSVVVYVLTIGPDSLADDVRTVADDVASTQDAILPSNA
jgi:hypothetical protein